MPPTQQNMINNSQATDIKYVNVKSGNDQKIRIDICKYFMWSSIGADSIDKLFEKNLQGM